MRKIKSKALRFGVFFLLATLFWVVNPVPESQALNIGDIRTDVEGYSKAGNIDSIADLAGSNPALAAEIATIAIETNPGLATDISCIVAGAVPDKAVEIARNATKSSPARSVDIACCIAEAVPQFAAEIAANVADVVPHEYAADIAGCVAGKVPDRAADIAAMVAQVAPEYEETIKQRVPDGIGVLAAEFEEKEGVIPPPAPSARPYGQ